MKNLFIIDPIEHLNFKKDSSIMMMSSSLKFNNQTYYTTLDELSVENKLSYCNAQEISFNQNNLSHYKLNNKVKIALNSFDVIFMRKEPPFDLEYIYATYALDLAKKSGVLVVNDPSALRDANEKFYITHFPEYIPKTLITRKKSDIASFLNTNKDIIIKPLDGMGGSSIFRVQEGDTNFNVISEVITYHEKKFVMVQEYLPAIQDGDKRIIIINGKPMKYSLARLAKKGENRANLAAGGSSEVRPLSIEESKIAEDIGKELKQKGILFAGVDMIGNKITEINITCPTCLQEINKETNHNGADYLMSEIEKIRTSS